MDIFCICERTHEIVHILEYDSDPQELVGTRIYDKAGEHITDIGFYSFSYIPTQWIILSVGISSEGDIEAIVSENLLSDNEYDDLVQPISAAISPESFGGDVDEFIAFTKSLGVPNHVIKNMVQGWQKQIDDCADSNE